MAKEEIASFVTMFQMSSAAADVKTSIYGGKGLNIFVTQNTWDNFSKSPSKNMVCTILTN